MDKIIMKTFNILHQKKVWSIVCINTDTQKWKRKDDLSNTDIMFNKTK